LNTRKVRLRCSVCICGFIPGANPTIIM
jgi:hypothetical protein